MISEKVVQRSFYIHNFVVKPCMVFLFSGKAGFSCAPFAFLCPLLLSMHILIRTDRAVYHARRSMNLLVTLHQYIVKSMHWVPPSFDVTHYSSAQSAYKNDRIHDKEFSFALLY